MSRERRESAEEVLQRIEQKRQLACKKGKREIILICLIDILAAAAAIPFSLSSGTSIAFLIIEIILAATLYFGVSAIRYVYAAVFGLLSLNIIHPLLVVLLDNEPSVYMAVIALLLIFRLVYLVSSSVILFGSKNITEYLYEKNNG